MSDEKIKIDNYNDFENYLQEQYKISPNINYKKILQDTGLHIDKVREYLRQIKEDRFVKRQKVTKINVPKKRKLKFIDKFNLYKKNLFKKVKSFDKIILFKIIVFIVFIASVIMTTRYNYKGFLKSMESTEAWISAIAFIGTILICVEAIIFIAINKKIHWFKRIIINIPIAVIGLVVMVVIMFNITTAQFETYQDKLFTQIVENNDNQYDLQLRYEQEEKELQNQYNDLLTEKNRRQDIIDKMDKDDRDYNFTYNSIYSKGKYYNGENIGILRDIEDVKTKLNEVRNNIKESLKSNTVTKIRRMTIYDYMNKYVFNDKINTGLIQFIQILLPSLIFDILSSLSLGLIFFLKSEKS